MEYTLHLIHKMLFLAKFYLSKNNITQEQNRLCIKKLAKHST